MSDDALDPASFASFLELALDEDRAREDVTAAALLEGDGPVRTAEVVAREDGVVAGLALLEPLFRLLDPAARVELLLEDGTRIAGTTLLARVTATSRALLAGERTALNLLQRLSGIATKTSAFVEATMATGVRIYDTRKTTPGLRHLEKYAVRCGGGCNHRMDLADAAMIKENHLVAAHGRRGPEAIAAAVRSCFAALRDEQLLYVEVETHAELEAVLEASAGRRGRVVVMLDDFEIGDIRMAARQVRALGADRPALEATGGIKLDTIEALASTGVSRLSSGAITHSVKALDIALKIRA